MIPGRMPRRASLVSLLLASLLLSSTAAAESYWVRPYPHGQANNGVQTLPGGVAWMVSDAGRVCRSDDYGVTWTMIEAFKTNGYRLRDVAFESPTHGVIVGAAGMVYVTWDGGVNWTEQKLPGGPLLSDVEWKDANTAVVVGDGPFVARTLDGGVTWSPGVISQHAHCVRHVSGDTWFAAGGSNIWRSTDNGATWPSVYSTSQSFYGIDFSDPNNGLACGSSAIYRTTDGGTNWTVTTGANGYHHWDVRYLSPTVAFTSMQTGQVARSVDGGATWTAASVVGIALPGLASSTWDANNAIIVGAFGHIMTTGDGGVTWQERTRRLDQSYAQVENVTDVVRLGGGTWFVTAMSGLYKTFDDGETFTKMRGAGFKSVSFRTPSVGIAVADSIYRTSDGGNTWTTNLVAPSTTDYVRYGPGGVALICGSHGIFRSTNDGASWTQVFSQIGANMRTIGWADNNIVFATGATAKRSLDGGATWATFSALNGARDVTFATPLVGTAIEPPGGLRFARTVDGGATWTAAPAQMAVNPPATAMRRVSMSDAYTGWAVGDSGIVMHTVNGGASWVRTASMTNVALNAVLAVDESTAVIGGGLAVGASSGVVAVVTSRQAQTPPVWNLGATGTGITLLDVAFADANVGVMCGQGAMFRTTNGGANWSPVGPAATLYGVTFVTPSLAVAVGVGGAIMRSADGGSNWSPVPSGTTAALLDVAFASPMVGCAVGQDVMLRTTDGGLNWTPLPAVAPPSSYLYGVAFGDADVGLCVAYGISGTSTILRTTDGGATWVPATTLPLTGLLDVAFASPTVAVAVGGGGGLYGAYATRSLDGGVTWAPASAEGTLALYGVTFTSPTEGFAVGEGSMILHSINGGANWLYEATDIQPPPAPPGAEAWSPLPGLESIRPVSLLAGPTLYGVGVRTGVGPVVVGASGLAAFRVTPLVAGVGDGLRLPATRVTLAPARPNPARGATTLEFELPSAGRATVRIFAVTGAEVATLADGPFAAGRHRVRWDAARAPSGVYFAQIQSGGARASVKLLVLN